jgi:uncharacterized protein (UPF0276 family)
MMTQMFESKTEKKPKADIGVGLRHSHYQQALNDDDHIDLIDFVEIHAENFFSRGGASQALLHQVNEKYGLSIHGTSLGLGSQHLVPDDVLSQFAQLVEVFQPKLVSEHLCFNRALVNGKLLHSGDLLPISYDAESLQTIVTQIERVQDRIKRPILIENLSAYLKPEQLNAELVDTQMPEFEFLKQMCRQSGCELLLDLNNLLINELNRGTELPVDYLKKQLQILPPEMVGEIHLAGYSEQNNIQTIIDDHGAKVSDQCWELFEYASGLFKGTPSLIEWDTNIPTWQVLLAEARKAQEILISERVCD